MIRVVLCCVVAGACAFGGFADIGPLPAKADRIWFTILPASPIKSAADFEIRHRYGRPDLEEDRVFPNEIRLVIRDSRRFRVVQTFPLNLFQGGKLSIGGSDRLGLSKVELQRMDELEDGAYFIAIVGDGERLSNVTELIIDENFDLDAEPILEVVALEPPPYRDLPFLAMRINGTSWMGIELMHSSFSHPGITADGVQRQRTVLVGGGLNGTLRPGDRWLRILEIDGALWPRIERGRTHEYSVQARRLEPVTIVASPDRPHGDAWDAAMYRESKRN